MDKEPPAKPQTIEAAFRVGTANIVGVLTAFSLAFLTAWAANPVPWGINDLFAIIPLAAGIVLELWSVAALLSPDSLEILRYRRAIRIFLAGVMLVLAGVSIAIVVDVLALAKVRLG